MKLIISIWIITLITSCSSVGRFGAGVDITFDPRTIGMQIDDTIMQKNLSARLALTDKKYFLSIQSEVRDGNIFLSGKVDEPEEKIKIAQIITSWINLAYFDRIFLFFIILLLLSFLSSLYYLDKYISAILYYY